MNKVIIAGKLGQDPELRITSGGTAVCNFSIATNEYSKDKDGNKIENVEWHRIVAWSGLAENCDKYLSKGRYAVIDGRLQTRTWEDKNGRKQYTTEIVANNVEFGPESKPTISEKQPDVNTTPGIDDIPF